MDKYGTISVKEGAILRKRKVLLILILTISLILTGCGNSEVSETPEGTTGNGEEVSNEVEENAEAEDEPPIYSDDIQTDITILEPDSIGTVYMEASYTNNSKYPITSYSAKILLKDKNETTYLSTHDTVMPGETSPNFECFGPDTGDPSDYEILGLELRARLDNGKTLSIEYDFKLNEARWLEYDN